MRKLVLLTVAAVFAITAVAYAVTNTMNYSAKMSYKGKPTKLKPSNMTYTGTLKIDTNPPGQQPDVGPSTTVYFSKAIKNNAKYFPSCTKGEFDGKPDPLSAKCLKAVVGKGTAEAFAGTPGNPKSSSVHECLTVKAINGPSGKTLFLAVTATTCPDGTQPAVQLNNRAIPGTIVKASGTFGFAVRFDIPADLQEQLGLKISLTDFKVAISGTPRKTKVGKVGYLQLTSCKGSLPVKAETKFKDTAGAIQAATSTSKAKC